MHSIIDFSQPWAPDGARLRHGFGKPVHVLAAHCAAEVRAVLDAVQQAAQQGLWCLGWLSYEAAAALDSAYEGTVHTGAVHTGADGASALPLAWFGVHEAPQVLSADGNALPAPRIEWQAGLERGAFDANISRIHAAIAAGECYQINYTAQLQGRLEQVQGAADQAARALFAALRRAQPGGYAALLDSGERQILSVSPELFFDWDGEQILTRPMKGTAPRGATPEQDEARARQMCASPKERAENVMIVDLLRNDLSRIAVPHSVRVPRLFHAEALPTVWQMTSDVVARTRPGIGLADVFAALFPCGSITGAPKRQAMRLIHALEPAPRGVYCGALGVVRPACQPGRIHSGSVHSGRIHATFNVPIRTLVLQGGRVSCGIGSGITASATAEAEWQEWRHKRAFLQSVSQP